MIIGSAKVALFTFPFQGVLIEFYIILVVGEPEVIERLILVLGLGSGGHAITPGDPIPTDPPLPAVTAAPPLCQHKSLEGLYPVQGGLFQNLPAESFLCVRPQPLAPHLLMRMSRQVEQVCHHVTVPHGRLILSDL